ncbi:MAG: hypothetical protein A2909_03305 [Candidatus Tagabacteria bacterium RIFCSPLOWO2_01_FULL_39_11]|uniref:Uncharacterized protein n=1 Tax=Candidatus Tagabacteria bacterium RIFCSPLOWO2_01_FULL_39_11 TaxID=1802295 RepID=A0A1G2LV64_9BACT|nr:MAG: hypothetical protein A2909_03305 [Candidatus Tagabacteria bacterium RIFCSPLOWO2_01_FULL_39_11]
MSTEIIENIEKQAKSDTEFARELRTKFFFHWAILSGAAITLFIPFVSSETVKNNITSCSELYIHITFVSFILSLVLSSLRNLVLAENVLKLGESKFLIANKIKNNTVNIGDKTVEPGSIQETLGYVAVILFIIGLISAYVFISKVIL